MIDNTGIIVRSICEAEGWIAKITANTLNAPIGGPAIENNTAFQTRCSAVVSVVLVAFIRCLFQFLNSV